MTALRIIHVIVAALLAASVLLQQRGSGLGDAFGSGSEVFSSRRGVEKTLYGLTIVFGAAFVALALAQLYLAK